MAKRVLRRSGRLRRMAEALVALAHALPIWFAVFGIGFLCNGELTRGWWLRTTRARWAWKQNRRGDQGISFTDFELADLRGALEEFRDGRSYVVVALDPGERSLIARHVVAQACWVLGPWPPPILESSPPTGLLPACIIRPSREGKWVYQVRRRYQKSVESASWTVYSDPRQ